MIAGSLILAYCLCLAAGILIMLEVGRRIGRRRLATMPEGSPGPTGVLDAAIFGLMGLLLAFTFSGAASRWEWRRNQVVEEANAIGTAYLRLDLLPPASQPELRETFRRYVHSRINIYEKMPDFEAVEGELKQSKSLQEKLWHQTVAAAKDAGSPAVMTLVLSNVNVMLDITTARTAALRAHLPFVVFLMLGITIFTSSLLAGYSMAGSEKRSWVHLISYTILITVAVYLILELEYPRIGFIRLNTADELLVQELEKMK